MLTEVSSYTNSSFDDYAVEAFNNTKVTQFYWQTWRFELGVLRRNPRQCIFTFTVRGKIHFQGELKLEFAATVL